MTLNDLSAEFLRSIIAYDPSTGEFTARVRRGKCKVGDNVCLTLSSGVNNYKRMKIVINKRHYMAHRLAWLHVNGRWPDADVDHKDGDPLNNRIDNLRLATDSQNLANMKKPITNKSGKKGVSWHAAGRCWQVHIKVEGTNHYLGHFPSVDDGHAAYCAAAEKMRGEFARFE